MAFYMDEARAADFWGKVKAADALLEEMIASGAKIVSGTYTGDNAASRTISLGTTPKAVLLIGRNGATRDGNYIYGGLVLPNSSVINMNGGKPVGPTAIEITTGGFNVYCNEGNQFKASTNSNMLQYHYIAII